MHHVLDDAFREDRSSAKKSKNNLALIRKFTYNLLRIFAIIEEKKMGIQDLMDWFADHTGLVMRYLYEEMESFY